MNILESVWLWLQRETVINNPHKTWQIIYMETHSFQKSSIFCLSAAAVNLMVVSVFSMFLTNMHSFLLLQLPQFFPSVPT